MPRVSILLTCYNHKKFIPVALDSIRAQTFTDYEIIALDDGSTDGTREWLADQTGIRVVFNEQNLGTYGTLNKGLDYATGEYIAVFNDDDVWMPTKLEKQVALLDSNPKVGLVHTEGEFIDGEGNIMEGEPLGFKFPRFETGDILLDLVYENKVIASAALFRRSIVDEIGGFNEFYFGSGDWEMWFRIAERYDVGCVNEKLSQYRVHGANASHKLEKIWRDDERLRDWMIPRLEDLGDRFPNEKVQAAIAHCWAALGTVRMLNGDARSARAAYRASMHVMPGRIKNYLRFAATFAGKKVFRKLL
ncbi:MAG: glycosyltransferase [Armatimonadetes bacterium]|nr:glycosyltransferase [Armatimonadota bacterium]